MTIDYTGRLYHEVNVETYVYLPIYSESSKCINNEWISIDDIDDKNIEYRRFNLRSIKQFKDYRQDHRHYSYDFKSEYCIVETYNGFIYPIHGSIEKWNEQLEKWKNVKPSINPSKP